MEKSYAFAAKQVALWAGFLCFALFLSMIYPILQTPQSDDPQLVCGNAIEEMSWSSDIKNGKILFLTNCAQCHPKNMKDPLTGPPLSEWRRYFSDEKEFYLYVHNPKNYRKVTKNKHLKALIKKYEPVRCTAYPTLTQEEVTSIISYIDVKYF